MTATKRAAEAAPEFPFVLADAESVAPQLRDLQARRLSQRCAISFAMAAVVAPLLHGEVAQ
jgi:hypothetical protein